MNNKPVSIIVSAVFTVLIISIVFNFMSFSTIMAQKSDIQVLQHKVNVLPKYQKALQMSDELMDRDELWDKDGSNLMTDYLNLRSEIDTAFMSGLHIDTTCVSSYVMNRE